MIQKIIGNDQAESTRLITLIAGMSILFFLASFLFGWNEPNRASAQSTDQTNPTPVIRVAVSESYVASVVEDALRKSARNGGNNGTPGRDTYTNPSIDLRAPDQAALTITARLANGIYVRPTANLKFAIVENRVDIEITELSMRGISLPRTLIQRQIDELTLMMEEKINRFVDQTESVTGLVLTNVQAEETELIIELSQPTPKSIDEGMTGN